ncbi:ABC transporter ATP-binding protein [Pseudorhodoferax aquiterrae]|uniref:ABC transporter ATP-binding protein n=1 Tax=Pseudorhodoferax aquiterrae TaxID=747304 RepID=A0ABQ3G1N9_9BURK|nr:ABC transporter ATP-binding protein [Pseudorhodoferax aquiterrae]GHC83637.1 ABC transporter ATP-binding protein [Pseudorhodoferax aquiterrae]
MAAPEPILQARQLQAGYGASQVLFGVDLDIPAGQVVTLLGRNGMGKSTTIKTLIGALALRGGSVRFGGQPLAGLRADAIARLGIAIVPEGRQCFPNLTVREHLLAFADQRNGQRGGWDLARLYALFPRLKEREQNMGNQLSGGEQQMLAIARALSTNPRLLILDEATEGLAPVIREEIWRCLARLKADGQTTLVVDKYIERLLPLADHHVVLERGRVVWQGDSAALDGDRAVWGRYLGV